MEPKLSLTAALGERARVHRVVPSGWAAPVVHGAVPLPTGAGKARGEVGGRWGVRLTSRSGRLTSTHLRRCFTSVHVGRFGSRCGANQTGPETQRDRITKRAIAEDMELVGIAEDIDVSASMSPFLRPDRGEWLTTRKNEWDVLIVLKIDRLVRSISTCLSSWTGAKPTGRVSSASKKAST